MVCHELGQNVLDVLLYPNEHQHELVQLFHSAGCYRVIYLGVLTDLSIDKKTVRRDEFQFVHTFIREEKKFLKNIS